MEVVAWLLVKRGWAVVTSLAVAPLLAIGYLFWPTLLGLALFALAVICSFLGTFCKRLADPRSYRLSNLLKYKLRSLFMVLTLAAAFCWWFRPERDPTGAVVAVCATVIEEQLGHDPTIVVYTPLDADGLSHLRNRMGRTTVVVRGVAEGKLRVLAPGMVFYVDKPTGRVAVHVSVSVERLKPGRAIGKFMYGDGENGGAGNFECKKVSGRWIAEIHVRVVS
jgi:hypothetical protein